MAGTALVLAVAGLATWPSPGSAQSVSPADREALVSLRVARGGTASEVDELIRHADAAAVNGLPVDPLTNKIREGLAKGVDPRRIEAVVQQMAANLATADRLVRELQLGAEGSARSGAVSLLAEALGGGVSPDEVRALGQAQRPGTRPLSTGELASAAKGLGFVKEAGLSASEGAAVMAEAVRQRFGPPELLDLGREIRRRESDYRTGRASLAALREAIARGDRPEGLFRESRPEPVERPSPTRPEQVDRPDRPSRPDVPTRPEAPARPDRPETPERPSGGRAPS